MPGKSSLGKGGYRKTTKTWRTTHKYTHDHDFDERARLRQNHFDSTHERSGESVTTQQYTPLPTFSVPTPKPKQGEKRLPLFCIFLRLCLARQLVARAVIAARKIRFNLPWRLPCPFQGLG